MSSASKETIHLGPMRIDFIVDAEDSDGTVTVFECFVPAGSKAAVPHSNVAFEETIYGLEGICTWTIDGQRREIGPGDSLCIRRGQVHGFENRSSGDVKMLAISTPGVFGPVYFSELSKLLGAAGPPDPAAVAELMHRHGLRAV
ncbi:MAG TPA: cupin domain-containing protein [Solirubrobacteraceae bacterium]|jgi:quercetin dioxygenase-like cupin family protein